MTIGGESNNTGFCIRDDAGTEVKSTDFETETYECTEAESPELILAFLVNMDNPEKFKEEAGRLVKERSQWHATEHKLINLLKDGQKLTIKNIRMAPKEITNCTADNKGLEDPDDKKLREGIRVGKKYLRLKKN